MVKQLNTVNLLMMISILYQTHISAKVNEILLNLKLKNFNLFVSPRSYLFIQPNYSLRKKLSLQVKTENKFESFFRNF